MNPKRLAQALNTISVGFAEAAEALNESDPSVSGSGPAAGRVARSAPASPSFDELPPDYEARYVGPGDEPQVQWNSAERAAAEAFQGVADYVNQPQGGLEACPKHHVPYTDGQYGPYCKQATDDPAWGKQKGDRLWCRITPKNAAEYLRIKAAA